jgi:hypothetical protein
MPLVEGWKIVLEYAAEMQLWLVREAGTMGDAALPKRCGSQLIQRRKNSKESRLSCSDLPTKISRIFSENEWILELRSDGYNTLCLLYCCVTRDLSRYQQTSVVIDATSHL